MPKRVYGVSYNVIRGRLGGSPRTGKPQNHIETMLGVGLGTLNKRTYLT